MRVISQLRTGSVEHWQWEAKHRYATARDLHIEEALGTPREFISAAEAQMTAWLHGLVARGLLFGKNWDEIRRAIDNAYFYNISEW